MSKVTQELSSKGSIQTQRGTQEKEEGREFQGKEQQSQRPEGAPVGQELPVARCGWDLVVVAYKVIRVKQRPNHKRLYQPSCGGWTLSQSLIMSQSIKFWERERWER